MLAESLSSVRKALHSVSAVSLLGHWADRTALGMVCRSRCRGHRPHSTRTRRAQPWSHCPSHTGWLSTRSSPHKRPMCAGQKAPDRSRRRETGAEIPCPRLGASRCRVGCDPGEETHAHPPGASWAHSRAVPGAPHPLGPPASAHTRGAPVGALISAPECAPFSAAPLTHPFHRRTRAARCCGPARDPSVKEPALILAVPWRLSLRASPALLSRCAPR